MPTTRRPRTTASRRSAANCWRRKTRILRAADVRRLGIGAARRSETTLDGDARQAGGSSSRRAPQAGDARRSRRAR